MEIGYKKSQARDKRYDCLVECNECDSNGTGKRIVPNTWPKKRDKRK
jgi:hypothetical protein